MAPSDKNSTNWKIVAFVLLGVIFLFLIFNLANMNGWIRSKSYYTSYWDSMAMEQYIITKYTDLDFKSLGNGRMLYVKNETNWMIQCRSDFSHNSVQTNCKEGEVKLGSYGQFLEWKNITYDGDSLVDFPVVLTEVGE